MAIDGSHYIWGDTATANLFGTEAQVSSAWSPAYNAAAVTTRPQDLPLPPSAPGAAPNQQVMGDCFMKCAIDDIACLNTCYDKGTGTKGTTVVQDVTKTVLPDLQKFSGSIVILAVGLILLFLGLHAALEG